MYIKNGRYCRRRTLLRSCLTAALSYSHVSEHLCSNRFSVKSTSWQSCTTGSMVALVHSTHLPPNVEWDHTHRRHDDACVGAWLDGLDCLYSQSRRLRKGQGGEGIFLSQSGALNLNRFQVAIQWQHWFRSGNGRRMWSKEGALLENMFRISVMTSKMGWRCPFVHRSVNKFRF